jgi:deazaflavin-dependent oxidoreductase (nitroreductase family)
VTEYLAPGVLVRKIANPIAMKLGVAATLSVRGRRSGNVQRIPVQVLEHEGKEYLVSARGEADWVRNLRKAGECEITRKGKPAKRYKATEVAVTDRQPLIDAYRAKWGSDVNRFFKSLPDAADHPVFTLEER